MILVDSSVWVDHLRKGDLLLTSRLEAGLVYIHPFMIGEIALESLRQREQVLSAMRDLPMLEQATDDEAHVFIEQQQLYRLGIGYIDAHLLASARLNPGMQLWTCDKRLNDIAARLGLAQAAQN